MAVQPGLCQTWSKILKTGFLTTRLILGQSFLPANQHHLHPRDPCLVATCEESGLNVRTAAARRVRDNLDLALGAVVETAMSAYIMEGA